MQLLLLVIAVSLTVLGICFSAIYVLNKDVDQADR
jgi:hypothetical protein